jgi:hypothetical protein
MDMNKSSFSTKEVELRMTMRKLFTDALTWQRIVSVETLAGAWDVNKAQDRLTQSQADIGSVFNMFYGADSGNGVTNLLKGYNQLLIDYTNAVKSHSDKTAVVNRIYDKADEIADYLSRLNLNWSRSDLSVMLRKYSDLLTSEIDLQNASLGSIDAKALDATFDESMLMADTFAFGIMKQFPGQLM